MIADTTTAGPSTLAGNGRSSSRVKVKSQRALESEDTRRLLVRAKERARAAGAASLAGEGSINGSADAESTVGAGDERTEGHEAKRRRLTKVGKRGKTGKKDREVWCVCKSKDGSGPMIECGECNDWFHFSCIDLDESVAERIHKYVCPSCEETIGHQSTRLFDITTFRSPTPPAGLIPAGPRPPAREVGATKRRSSQKGTPRREPAAIGNIDASHDGSPPVSNPESEAEAGSGSGSDDRSSEADHSSASSSDDSDSDASGELRRTRPSKKARPTTGNMSSATPARPAPKTRQTSTAVKPTAATPTSVGKKGRLSDFAPGKIPSLPPARQFVLYKLTDVVKAFFADNMEAGEVEGYAAELEGGLFAGFRDVVAGKETAGARYKTQFGLLSSSLQPRLQETTKTAILSRTLSPAQVAVLSSADLASQARADEIANARRESLQQTIRQKEDFTGAVRVGRDGIETFGEAKATERDQAEYKRRREEEVKSAKEKQEAAIAGREGEENAALHRRESLPAQTASPMAQTPSRMQPPAVPGPQSESYQTLPAEFSEAAVAAEAVAGSAAAQTGSVPPPSSSASASPIIRRDSTIPPSPVMPSPSKRTFDLTSAWGSAPGSAIADLADGQTFEPFVSEDPDQSTLDLSDIIHTDDIEEDDPLAIDVDLSDSAHAEKQEEATVLSEMEVYLQRPAIFTCGLTNVNDRSCLPRTAARLVSNPSLPRNSEADWRYLFPHDPIEWTGRLPSKSAISFLSQMRLNPKKEVFALGLTLTSGEAAEVDKRVFTSLVDDYVARDRYAVYQPYGDNPPHRATKEIYAIPLRPGDRYPDFLDLLDGLKVPNVLDEPMWIVVVALNREEPPVPVPYQAAPPPAPHTHAPVPAPTAVAGLPPPQDLQALMRSLGTLPVLPTPPHPTVGFSPLAPTVGGATPYTPYAGGATPVPPGPASSMGYQPWSPANPQPGPRYPPYPGSEPGAYPPRQQQHQAWNHPPPNDQYQAGYQHQAPGRGYGDGPGYPGPSGPGDPYRDGGADRERNSASAVSTSPNLSSKPTSSGEGGLISTLSRFLPGSPARSKTPIPSASAPLQPNPVTTAVEAVEHVVEAAIEKAGEVLDHAADALGIANEEEQEQGEPSETAAKNDSMAAQKQKAGTASATSEPIDVDKEVDEVAAEGEDEQDPAAESEEGDDDGDEDEEGDDNGEFEVEKIHAHQQQAGKFIYLVGWQGYGPEHNTWEPQENVEHCKAIVEEYWAKKPKPDVAKSRTPKGGRASQGGAGANKRPKAEPASQGTKGGGRSANGAAAGRGGSKRKATAISDDEEDQGPNFQQTHVDSIEKYEDVADWETLVDKVDTIERTEKGELQVYLTMTGGEKVCQTTEVAYRRCPQKLLKFFESHLRWKHTDAE